MTILDFKEIAQSNIGGEEQDKFELFARDFFKYLGYKIVDDPDRGQDGGKDILIEEERVGILGRTSTIRWLVSCKHFAHSKKSRAVGSDDELDILVRVKRKKCNGFIGFYSTIPSSGLTQKLNELKETENMDFETYDYAKIEYLLLDTEKGREIASRYFEQSYNRWVEQGKLAESMLQISRKVYKYISNNKDIIIAQLQQLVASKSILYQYMMMYQTNKSGPNPEVLSNLIEELTIEIDKLHKIFSSKHIYLDNPERDDIAKTIDMISTKVEEEIKKIIEFIRTI
ncbi:restriction endonuclease [Metabacillus fastidiosus]|uniref:restriction endonuclease n=1 Tax=Metabacillus fastidiosus TaxID=1458 RepID=UPI002DB56385|nr:restriction endonuclease [Metabacillus fastidiosus]MEC2078322.1 restriction endonuclease [Metabacillus fastidiosus]